MIIRSVESVNSFYEVRGFRILNLLNDQNSPYFKTFYILNKQILYTTSQY
jgi:hypothetical protein